MRKKIIALIICSLLLIYFIGGIFYNIFYEEKNNNENIENKIGDTIKGFNYIVYENDLEIYKKEFNNLKKILESEEIDYKEYAISISKLFLIDLYTLDNKKNKYDVGGTEFIYPEIVENYKLNVENTLYKYIIDNSDNKRTQKLPEVKNIILDNIEETIYTLGENKFDAYKLNLRIEYIEDLEYDTDCEIIITKNDKYLYIVEKN